MKNIFNYSNSVFANLGCDAKRSLKHVATLIEAPTEVKTVIFVPATNYEETAIEKVAGWCSREQPCLYIFELIDAFDVSEVGRAFNYAKNNLIIRKFSKINSENGCLYVGSSKDLKKRFKEHLGFGSAATYALQLSHWAPSLNLKIKFSAALYPATTTQEVLQLLENTLWDKQKPMFGKRGGK